MQKVINKIGRGTRPKIAGHSVSRPPCSSYHSVQCSLHEPPSILSSPHARKATLFAGVNRRIVQQMRQNKPHLPPSMAAYAPPAPTASTSQSSMKTVEVNLGDRSYPIYIGPALLDHGELLRKHVPSKSVLIVTNETIAPLYLDK